jgi:hypothetical protein
MEERKYRSEYCDDTMSFEECELAILRHAVDETEKIKGKEIANSEEVRVIISILEDYLIHKKLVCYGGTAINNILPQYDQFYDRDVEVPDYDFFSPNALDDAKELADLYYQKGYVEVEAKAGVHPGTFKVFVNFLPIADITYMVPTLYEEIHKESIMIAGIRYAPPNYLRMSMFLELSRPEGDVSRWEKVLKRLTLLNKHYPLDERVNCYEVDFQRRMDDVEKSQQIYYAVRDSLIEQGVVFFGAYGASLYSKYMPKPQQRIVRQIPDFDVLSENPERCSLIVRERLESLGFKNVKEVKHAAIGEVIPDHIEILVGKDTVAFVYRPIACHNYNTIEIDGRQIHVATIDTMLSFYLAFLYAKEFLYYKERILCMAKFLFEVEQKNRLAQHGLLKRFSINCYGKQPTLESMRAEKNEKFKELASKRGTREYEMWFLKYNPSEKFSNDGNVQKKKEENLFREKIPKEKKRLRTQRRNSSFLRRFIEKRKRASRKNRF